MTTFGLWLIVVALGCVVVMFGITLDLRAQRDAAQAYAERLRYEFGVLAAQDAKQGGAQ